MSVFTPSRKYCILQGIEHPSQQGAVLLIPACHGKKALSLTQWWPACINNWDFQLDHFVCGTPTWGAWISALVLQDDRFWKRSIEDTKKCGHPPLPAFRCSKEAMSPFKLLDIWQFNYKRSRCCWRIKAVQASPITLGLVDLHGIELGRSWWDSDPRPADFLTKFTSQPLWPGWATWPQAL